MDSLRLTRVPVARTGMLIRKRVEEVFEAVINPEITTKFWFTRGSGPLEVGKTVQWDWEMYGIAIPVTPTMIEPTARIALQWPGQHGPTTVEWTFAAQPDGTTFVRVTHDGFAGGRRRAREAGCRFDPGILSRARRHESVPRAQYPPESRRGSLSCRN